MCGGGADPDPGQVGIELHIQPGRPPLQPAQHQVLHCVKAQRPQVDGIFHRCVHLLLGEGLQQPEHLYELPFAPPSHAGLQQTPQRPELIGEFPSLQRRGLVQGARFPLQQREVVDGVVDEVVPVV